MSGLYFPQLLTLLATRALLPIPQYAHQLLTRFALTKNAFAQLDSSAHWINRNAWQVRFTAF